MTGVRPQIKWPNDLVLGGRKLAGILTEMSLEGESGHVSHVVVGIGINVHQQPEDFTGEVADIATSLGPVPGRECLPGPVGGGPAGGDGLPAPGGAVHPGKMAGGLPGGLPECRQDRAPPSGRCRETVQALRIDEQYGLVVRHEDGSVETVRSGEVSVRGLYGYTE